MTFKKVAALSAAIIEVVAMILLIMDKITIKQMILTSISMSIVIGLYFYNKSKALY